MSTDPEPDGTFTSGTTESGVKFVVDARGSTGMVIGEGNTQTINVYHTPDQVEAAQQKLAHLVLAQWRDEIVVRQLDDSEPLVLRWVFTRRPISDHPENIGSNVEGGERFGSTDQVGKMIDAFRNLRRGRLVILGTAGMGKTTLAILLMRELLETRQPGDAVPVLVTMTGWDPREQAFQEWLARRLAEMYPPIRAAAFGADAARALVAQRKILPILDGLDELPKPLQPLILAALNASMTRTDKLILTCRTAEYAAAVAAPGGDVLTGGAVIEPLGLARNDIATYFKRCLPPQVGGGWPMVLSALDSRQKTPLTKALTTPLDVWLLRRVYIDTATDPAELADRTRFATAAAITQHLLDNIVQALITARRLQRESGDHNHPFQPSKTWNVDRAQHWLSFLAYYMNIIQTRDFGWWRLPTWRPGRVVDTKCIRTVASLLFGLLFAIIGGLVFMSWDGFLFGWVVGTSFVLTGSGASVRFALRPTHTTLRLRGRVRTLLKELAFGLLSAFPIGLYIGLSVGFLAGVVTSTSNLRIAFKAGLPAGLAATVMFGLMTGLFKWAAMPLPEDKPEGPRDSLRRDMRLIYLATAVVIAIAALGAALGFRLPALRVALLLAAPTVWFAVWLAALSPGYMVAVLLLWARGCIPREMMRFLDDARRVGLLRQVGPVYQFRHAAIQDHLARQYQARHKPASSWAYGA